MPSFPIRPEIAASLACLAVIAFLAVCYALGSQVYFAVLDAISIQPWPFPFLDWLWVPSSVHCWERGVNVYLGNTCLSPVSPFSYSPLLLRASFLPESQGWTDAIGLTLATLFALSILALRPPRSLFALIVLVLTTVSGGTAFALERGNWDVVSFLLAMAAILAWSRPMPMRLLGYALFAFDGVIKFYPFVLFVLALRERRRMFVLIALAACCVLGAFVWAFASELRMAMRGVPGGGPFFTWIGAMVLPAALAPHVAASIGTGGHLGLVQRLLWMALSGAAVLLGALLATQGGVRAALERMSERDLGMLVGAALLMSGCFVAGNSNTYRSIFLIPAVPGLLHLARDLPRRWARVCFTLGCLAAPLVTWAPGIKRALQASGLNPSYDASASAWGLAHFFLNELAWWWLITVLLASVIGFVLSSALRLMREHALPLPLPGKAPL